MEIAVTGKSLHDVNCQSAFHTDFAVTPGTRAIRRGGVDGAGAAGGRVFGGAGGCAGAGGGRGLRAEVRGPDLSGGEGLGPGPVGPDAGGSGGGAGGGV